MDVFLEDQNESKVGCHVRKIRVSGWAVSRPPGIFEAERDLELEIIISSLTNLKGAKSRLAHLKTFSLNFSNSSFVIRVNLLHP